MRGEVETDASDGVRILLGEPERPAGAGGDARGAAPAPDPNAELGHRATRCDPPDAAAGAVLREPEVPIRARRDASDAISERDPVGEAGHAARGRDAINAALVRNPEVSVGPGGDGVPAQSRKLGHSPCGRDAPDPPLPDEPQIPVGASGDVVEAGRRDTRAELRHRAAWGD